MPPPIGPRVSRVLLTGLAAAVLAAVAGYVGVPDDGNMKYRTGTGYWYPPEDDWESGDHPMRCYLYLDKNVTGSLKGGGSKALPVS